LLLIPFAIHVTEFHHSRFFSYLCPLNYQTKQMISKEDIRSLLEEALPLVDLDSDFLFSELDSLGVTTILMLLSAHYGITLESEDATPKNLKSLESLAALVEAKLQEK